MFFYLVSRLVVVVVGFSDYRSVALSLEKQASFEHFSFRKDILVRMCGSAAFISVASGVIIYEALFDFLTLNDLNNFFTSE